MIVASKGAAGVTGAGPGHAGRRPAVAPPDLVDGVGLIVGIDRFMSEARALTNFAGNAVATVLIGTWTGEGLAAGSTGPRPGAPGKLRATG
jgi:aerobic C4-dicarboxylate transport protein